MTGSSQSLSRPVFNTEFALSSAIEALCVASAHPQKHAASRSTRATIGANEKSLRADNGAETVDGEKSVLIAVPGGCKSIKRSTNVAPRDFA